MNTALSPMQQPLSSALERKLGAKAMKIALDRLSEKG